MVRETKKETIWNKLESLDQFKVEHNFKYTSKETKGTITGFCLTTLYFFLLILYFYQRMTLFWTHDEDTFGQFQEALDMEKKEQYEYKDFQIGSGIMLWTTNPQYFSVFESEEEINQYVQIYSTEYAFEGVA